MIIDFHTHFYPDKVAPRAIERGAAIPEIGTPAFDGTLAGLLAGMRRDGIDVSVGLPLVNTPANANGVNRWAAGIAEPGIVMLGSVHPYAPEVIEQVGKVAAAGFKGVKVHPEYQQFTFADTGLDPVWRACAEAGLFVITHAGADCGFPPPWKSCPRDFLALHRRIPSLKLVLAHFGGWAMWDEVDALLIGEDIYLDTAFLAGFLPPERLKEMIRRHGADKVLFGSDAPWCGQAASVEYLLSAGLDADENAMILAGNAVGLLGLAS